MNILNEKFNHPNKGPLEVKRWSKADLAMIVVQLERRLSNMEEAFKRYHTLYGFHVE